MGLDEKRGGDRMLEIPGTGQVLERFSKVVALKKNNSGAGSTSEELYFGT